MATADLSGLFGSSFTPQEQQQQLIEQQALQQAQMSPSQRLAYMGYQAGAKLGQGVGGLLGENVQDPLVKKATMLRQLAQDLDVSTTEGLQQYATRLQQAGFNAEAAQLGNQIRAARKTEAEMVKYGREALTPEQRNAQAAADTTAPRGSPEWMQTYKKELTRLTTKEGTTSEIERMIESLPISPEEKAKIRQQYVTTSIESKGGKGEFERLLAGMNLTPEQEKMYKKMRLEALANPDPSGLKDLTAELKSLQVRQSQLKIEETEQKQKDIKTQAINRLSSVETDIDNSFETATKALKLAPTDFIGASQQALLKNIPWTDSKALNNLVSSLNSDKTIQTLNDLKAQSRTGATGFGAMNTRELQLVLDKTRALDPQDKMFKENLTFVLNGWNKIRQQAQESRIDLQGNGPKLQTLKQKISAVRAKGSMSAAEKAEIESLKDELGVR